MQAGEVRVIGPTPALLAEGCSRSRGSLCVWPYLLEEAQAEENAQGLRWEAGFGPPQLESLDVPGATEWAPTPSALGPVPCGLCSSSVCLSVSLGCFFLLKSKPFQLRAKGLGRFLLLLQPAKSQGRILIGLAGSCDHVWTNPSSLGDGGL